MEYTDCYICGENGPIRVNKNNVIVIDTETTGLPDEFHSVSVIEHEILQLVMIDGTGSILINELFKPVNNITWPKAQIVHGIGPEDVLDKSAITNFTKNIQFIVDSANLIVAYNLQFDLFFLRAIGITFSGKYYYDVMHEFARKHANNRRYGSGKFVTLKKCAAYYGYRLADAHNAEADARATLHCFLKMQGEDPLNG